MSISERLRSVRPVNGVGDLRSTVAASEAGDEARRIPPSAIMTP